MRYLLLRKNVLKKEPTAVVAAQLQRNNLYWVCSVSELIHKVSLHQQLINFSKIKDEI